MKKNQSSWVWLGATAALLQGATAVAADSKESSGYVGLTIGAAIPSTSGSSTRITYGANGGYNIAPEWTLGAFVLTSSEATTVTVPSSGSVSTSQRTSFFGVEGHYNVSQLAKGFQAGLKVGLVTDSVSTPTASTSNTDLVIGPKIAYDHELQKNWSVGGEFNTLFILGTSTSSVINFLGVVKYWFP